MPKYQPGDEVEAIKTPVSLDFRNLTILGVGHRKYFFRDHYDQYEGTYRIDRFDEEYRKAEAKWEVGTAYLGTDTRLSKLTFTVTAVDEAGNALIRYINGDLGYRRRDRRDHHSPAPETS